MFIAKPLVSETTVSKQINREISKNKKNTSQQQQDKKPQSEFFKGVPLH